MGRIPIRAKLVLDAEAKSKLETIAKSRTEGQARIERAKVLLAYYAGERVTALAKTFQTNRPKIPAARENSPTCAPEKPTSHQSWMTLLYPPGASALS